MTGNLAGEACRMVGDALRDVVAIGTEGRFERAEPILQRCRKTIALFAEPLVDADRALRNRRLECREPVAQCPAEIFAMIT
jgi:hypothetical protein